MALVKCKECGKDVSACAKTCPHCGISRPGVKAKDIVTTVMVLVAVGIALVKCASDPPFTVTLPADTPPEAMALVENNWDKLKGACPGLDRYSKSLTFSGLDVVFGDWAEPRTQRVDIKFRIPGDGGTIPASYAAHGHTCYFGISRDGRRAVISKRACQSICLDRDMSQSVDTLSLPL
jgi:hypothetical protein